MIKGVNRQIIEVTDTGSVYYERALLVVRPEYTSAQRTALEREAKRMLKGMKAPSSIKRSHAVAFWLLRIGLTAAASCILTLLIYNGFFA